MKEGGGERERERKRERERREKVGEEKGGRETPEEKRALTNTVSVCMHLHPAGLSSDRVP